VAFITVVPKEKNAVTLAALSSYVTLMYLMTQICSCGHQLFAVVIVYKPKCKCVLCENFQLCIFYKYSDQEDF